MGEPLTWGRDFQSRNDSGDAGQVGDLCTRQQTDCSLLRRLRAISVWREPNEVPSGVAREEFRAIIDTHDLPEQVFEFAGKTGMGWKFLVFWIPAFGRFTGNGPA